MAESDSDASPHPPGPADRLIESAERTIDSAVAELDFDGPVQHRAELGFPTAVLADASASVDVMVCGSRGYGLARQVLLGGVSTRLLRSAACPVIVTPRSAAHH